MPRTVVAGFTPKEGVHYTGAVVQRGRAQPRARLPQQADDHRLDLADRVRGVHPEEPAPQPRRKCRGDEKADRAASRKRRRGAAHRRHGGVRLQLSGRHRAGAGDLDPGRRAGDRRGSRRRHQVLLARRHDGLGDADAHRAGARRSAQPLAGHADLAAPARHARSRRRQRACRAQDGRDPVRLDRRRARRLPVRRPA